MGLYRAISQIDGQEYPFEIDGDTPTEEESLAISNYMANIGKQDLPEETPGDDGNLFTKGIGRGIDNIQMLYGSAIEGVGKVTGLEDVKDYGTEIVENNRKELESDAEYAKRLDDIKDTGSFFDWAASTLGEQVPQLGSTLAGAGAGFLVGGVPGSIIGGIGVNLPFFYGGNREAQKEEVQAGNRFEISEGAAFITALPQAALDFIADRFLVSGFTGKALSGGGIFTRGVKGVGKGIVTEVPTEIGQQVLERYQAGKSITSEEAINEYKEVAAAAGLIGGTVSSTGNIIGGDKNKEDDNSKTTQLDQDQRTLGLSAGVMNQNAQNFLNRGLPSPTTQGKVIEDSSDPEAKFLTLSLLPDHIKQEVMDNRPDVVVTDETLSQDDLDVALNRARDLDADPADVNYNKVKDKTKLEGVFNQGSARKALKTKQQKTIKQSEINRIRDKLLQNGVIKKKKGKFVSTTTMAQDIGLKAEQLKARAKTIMKEMDALHKQRKQKLETKEDVSDLEGQITDLTLAYDGISKQARTLSGEAKKKLGTESVKASQIVPPIIAKTAFNNANIKTDEYKSKEFKVQKALREKLTAIGLGDIALDFRNIVTKDGLDPQQQVASGEVNEGVFGNKTIALAMEIYDPSLSEADLQQRLGSVMNHEIIHALKEMGVFTEAEWKTLTDAAKETKYVMMIDGKPVTRKYTYLDRSVRMNEKLTDSKKLEEAVAEMYRDFADGKLELKPKTKTIFQKILSFIKGLFTAHKEVGFNSAGDIFKDIGTTDIERQIGRRERQQNITSEKKYSTAGIVAGYIEPEKGNIERIKQTFKDVTKRVDDLQEAAKKLANGEIDYDTYDKLVNKVKPIVPYTTVPEPATVEQMKGALAKNKVEKLNKINDIPDGTTVKLRLDIPAYTGKGVWVPTIHDASNKVLSHESVAVVNNATLRPSEGAQRIGFRIAQGAEKGPFATIEGELQKVSPETAFTEAQSALNDPSFVQVGFDPERHSYFYDRTTTQPVMSAERVIQVGPLVMAKNPTFAPKEEFLYSSIKGINPKDLTALDKFITEGENKGQYEQIAKIGSVKMVEAIKKIQAERGGVTLNINDPEDRKLIVEAMKMELDAYVDADDSAIGWYKETFDQAKKLYALEYPEIKTDKNAESVFNLIIAISSNGAAVKEQNQALAEQFENWKRTGLLLEKGYGKQASGMIKSFKVYNLMKSNMKMSDTEIKTFLDTKTTVGEINNLPILKQLKAKITTENVGTEVPASFIFGSKIGSFYQNLAGDFSYLTMDRWFMRFVNRITGHPFIIPTEKTMVKARNRVKEAVQKVIESGTDDDKSRLSQAIEENGVDLLKNPDDVDAISLTVDRVYQRDFSKLGQDGLPEKSEFILATASLARNINPQLAESPRGGRERETLRSIIRQVVSEYNNTPRRSNRTITIADAQAVFWYGEKRLFKSIGVAPGQGSDNDYVDAAVEFLRKRGRDEETIGQALPAADRDRRLGKPDTGQQAVRSTGEPEKNVGHQKREYTTEELEGHDLLSESTEEEIRAINETIEEQQFSMIPIPQELKSNIYADEGNARKYIYGMIQARGRTIPVLYVEGDHEKVAENDYSGYGEKHITAIRDETGKSHEQELLEIFKYNNLRKLLYDNLAKAFYQQTKGTNNGFNLVDTPSTGIRLEFNKTPHNGPRNYQLIMPLKFVPKGTPLDPTSLPMKSDVYVIRTAYPSEKKYSYSSISAPIMNQQATPTSEVVNEGINQTRQKIRYDNLSKILTKIGYVFTAGRVDEETLRRKSQDLLIQIQDRFLPIGALMDGLRDKGLNISDSIDTYMQEELFHGVAGAKVDKSQKEFFEPMIKVIDSLNVSQDKLNELSNLSNFYKTATDGRYPSKKMALADAILYASHAKERNDYLGNDIASGMHTNEANRILDWSKTLSDTESTKLNNIISFAQQIVQNTNQERRQGGLIPERFVDKDGKEYTEIYENYVPLRGDLDFEQEINADNEGDVRQENFVIQNLFGALKKPDRKAKGRIRSEEGELQDFYASDIVASLFAQNNKSIADSERNKVGLSYLQLVRGVADGETEVNVNLQKEMQHISHVYFDRDDIPQDMKDKVLTVRENGQNVFVTFTDPRIARAMKGMMTPDSVGSFTRALGKLNRYLSNINTTYNPSFVIPNFARDLATAGVNVQQYDEKGLTSEVLKGALPAVKGIAKNLRDGDTDGFWAKEYLKFVNAGGKNATNQMNDLQDQMNRINGILSDVADNNKKGKLGLVKNGFKKLGKFLDDYNTAVENGVRVATYTALVKRGVTPARAAQAARNITVNFAKGGEQKQFLNSWYLFYNASLQGSMALINAAVKSKRVRKVWAGLVVYGLMQDAFNSMLSGDEDEDGIKDYDELPRYILEHNFVLPTFGLADDKFITIPLAYGMNIAVNLGRAMSRAARGEYTPGEASRTIFGTAFESLSPFGGFDNFYNLAAPTVLDPFVSVAINEDYKGDPIFKESPQFASRPTPNSQAYWSSTSGIAKSIANTLNTITGGDEVESGFIDLSPDVMEFWFDYSTGGVGRFVQRSLETPANIYDAINGDFQGSVTRAIPFARKVVASPSEREDVSNYLENRKALFTILARYDIARKSGDMEKIKELLEDNKEQLAIVPRLKAVDNARNRLLRQIKEIERNPRIDETMKKNLIRIRRDRINDLMRRGLILMRSAGFREAS